MIDLTLLARWGEALRGTLVKVYRGVLVFCTFPQHALTYDLDLSLLLPSPLYWFVHISTAGRIQLLARVTPQHPEPASNEGSTLHLHHLPREVHPIWPSASDVLNADWLQRAPCSIQIAQHMLNTVYTVSQNGESQSVTIAGHCNLGRSLVTGVDRRINLMQMLGVGFSSLVSARIGLITYGLWYSMQFLGMPHSSLSVLRSLLTFSNRRPIDPEKPPPSIPNLQIILNIRPGEGIESMYLGHLETGFFQPWQSLLDSGVTLQTAPQTPPHFIDEAVSHSRNAASSLVVDRAFSLCGGLRRFSMGNHGDALIWRCPVEIRNDHPYTGGYLGLISHQLLMRIGFFRGEQHDLAQLRKLNTDLRATKDN